MVESGKLTDRLQQIMLNPLSYVHLQRLHLSCTPGRPRQRAAVNEMLVGCLPRVVDLSDSGVAARQLLKYWRLWPEVCTLVGAQLLKQELAWRGNFLRLSERARFFMSLPLRASGADYRQAYVPVCLQSCEVQYQVQGLGLCQLLEWQSSVPEALKGRLRLLFSPELDGCFEHMGKHSMSPDLFLISQAIQYAKNHTDHV